LLNDGAILSIAYDNVRYKNAPESWNMRLVLGIATVLGIIGPIAAFGLFYLGDQVFHLSHNELQPMMYLMLSVAGHLTIFLTRTRGPFWSISPAAILCVATGGTQILATFIAVYGFLMPPLGWKWAGFVWAYALIWALVSDQVKLLAYRLLDPVKVDTTSETQSESKSEAKDGPKHEVKAAPKTDGKDEPKPEAKADPNPDVKAEPKLDGKVDPKPEIKTPSEVTPQLVKRVHELYEELGREEVRAVEDWEKKEQEAHKDASDTAHK
jgi:H+-transporting ATPase